MKKEKIDDITPRNLPESRLEQISLLIRLRWSSVVLVFIIFLYSFFSQRTGPSPFPLFVLFFLTLLFNLALHLDLKKNRTTEKIGRLEKVLSFQIYFDIFYYLLFFHFTGGIESPFFVLLVFPALSATLVLFPTVRNYSYVLLTILCFGVLLYLETHWRLNPSFLMTRSVGERAFFLLLALAGVLWLSVYPTSRLIRSLRERLNSIILLKANLQQNYLETVTALAQAVETKEPEIKGHLEKSIGYAVLIGEEMNLPEEEIEILKFGAILHDIGKIGVDEKILFKPGPLSPAEYEEIKKHPGMGIQITTGVGFLKKVEPIILYHHERYDGTGYPEHLAGKEIPLLARIMSVVDAFEGMT
ncbi:MAG: HD domain-containing protein, partial [Candidatus Omnitrophica bacterium]|nr:HD domain-containing protein [Candidatus Omnitrophota bacterium]